MMIDVGTPSGITYQPTMRLRLLHDDTSDHELQPTYIQQAWLGSDGSVWWEKLEVVRQSELDQAACPEQ